MSTDQDYIAIHNENHENPEELAQKYHDYCQSLAGQWSLEQQTWLLVKELLIQRFADTQMDLDQQSLFYSDEKLFQRLVGENRTLDELIRVKHWLEATAPAFQPVEVQPYLPYTTNHIQKHLKQKDIITELDPDAQTRQNKFLVADDQQYQSDLMRTLFQYFRRGEREAALDLCVQAGQAWRAATLQGFEMAVDNFVDGLESEDFGPGGTQNRALWKAICYSIANESKFDIYQRALYAVCCGNLENILPVCETWEDHVWAHFTSLLETQLEKGLLSIGQRLKQPTTLQMKLPEYNLDKTQVFDMLLKHENPEIQDKAKDPFRIIQAHLILDSMDMLLQQVCHQLQNEQQIPHQEQVLRFLVHLILMYDTLEVHITAQDEHVYLVFKHYIQTLIQSQQGILVPLFLNRLPQELQIECYADFLQTVPKEEMAKYYHMGLDEGLDMFEIAKTTVYSIFLKHGSMDSLEDDYYPLLSLTDPLSKSDITQIDALEWLRFEDNAQEYITASNLLIERFLCRGRINAVQHLMNTHSVEAFAEVKGWNIQLQYRQLIDTISLYDEWAQLFSKTKTRHDPLLLADLQTMTPGVVEAFDRLFETPVFGNEFLDPEDEPTRSIYMIQDMYIPDLVLWLHQVLYQTRLNGYLEKSLELANLVAGDGSNQGVHHSFTRTGKLQRFMEAMRQSAVQLLEKMPWATLN
ncbi:nuclear pore protein 84/107 [Gorgonomyces haynaldii]|nr:nuclear pore protein 84/107 [Gorgonomyces haynaldii]